MFQCSKIREQTGGTKFNISLCDGTSPLSRVYTLAIIDIVSKIGEFKGGVIISGADQLIKGAAFNFKGSSK